MKYFLIYLNSTIFQPNKLKKSVILRYKSFQTIWRLLFWQIGKISIENVAKQSWKIVSIWIYSVHHLININPSMKGSPLQAARAIIRQWKDLPFQLQDAWKALNSRQQEQRCCIFSTKQKENAIYMETHRICPASAIWVEAGERSIQHLWAIRGFSAKQGNSTNTPPSPHNTHSRLSWQTYLPS